MKIAGLNYFVPTREWAGGRCFILCGGESLKAQRKHVPALKGRVIAVKQTAVMRPNADLMFVGAKSSDPELCASAFAAFRGEHLVSRSYASGFPERTIYVRRTKLVDRLSREPGIVAGQDCGTSAINLAYQLGAAEIVLMGYDMAGGRWLNGEMPHPLPRPPQEHFDRHLVSASGLAKDLAAEGIKVWNASPTSAATFFEYRPLESFL